MLDGQTEYLIFSMNNIKTVQSIANRIAKGERDFGRVYCVEDGDYVLLNYTHEAQFGGDFTEVEKACRGLVIRTDGKIMALCMSKFFNLGEPQCPSLPDEPYTVWEKADGSLGLWWHDGDKWRVNTRGSFDNEYTEFATHWWEEHVDALTFPKHFTVMTEICFDADPNPRAVNQEEGLYLIAVRDKYSGKDFLLAEPTWYESGLYPVKLFNVKIDNLSAMQQEQEGTEGWVVRFDSGFRVKIKTAWYLRLFRAMTALTPKRIRELMMEAGESWIDEFPDDLRPEAVAIQEEIEQKYRSVLDIIYKAYSKVAAIETRKGYAQAVLAEYPEISGWLFKLRDNKFDELEVLKKLDLHEC